MHHRTLLYIAYGSIAVTAVLHFLADVVGHHYRIAKDGGAEPSLYYGLHSAYVLGQLAFGVAGLLIVGSGSDLLSQPSGQVLSFVVVIGWLAISFIFMPYIPPRANNALSLALLVAAACTK